MEILWEKKLLGESTPQSLLDTVVFLNGLYFALRSGKEHHQLRYHPHKLRLLKIQVKDHISCILKTYQRINQEESKAKKQKPKVVIQHANLEQPERCLVRLYKLYNSLCPKDHRPAHCLYLQPLSKPKDGCWYSRQPYGHNHVAETVARLCRNAGIPGYKTNHSLRATNATWLFDSDVDEQLIMERTGHLSSEGVRLYKHTSEVQREKLSDILNCSKKPCLQEDTEGCSLSYDVSAKPQHSLWQQQVKCAFQPGNFNLHQCGSVTINFNTSSSNCNTEN